MSKEPLLVNLHIPFCPGHCVCCEEKIVGQNVGYLPRYLLALEKEIASAAEELEDYSLRSVHLHPDCLSLLGVGVLDNLLNRLETLLPADADTEWVVEAMPGELSPEMLFVLQKRHRVGRIVLELMGSTRAELSALHRPYTENVAQAALRQLAEHPVQGLDISYAIGLPGQSPEMLAERLKALLPLGAGQISLRRYHDRRLAPAAQREYAEETDWAAYIEASVGTLGIGGYARTGRTLHFAREGMLRRECFPEAANWAVMGFGLGVVTSLDGLRYRNTPDYSLYLEHADDPSVIAQLL